MAGPVKGADKAAAAAMDRARRDKADRDRAAFEREALAQLAAVRAVPHPRERAARVAGLCAPGDIRSLVMRNQLLVQAFVNADDLYMALVRQLERRLAHAEEIGRAHV